MIGFLVPSSGPELDPKEALMHAFSFYSFKNFNQEGDIHIKRKEQDFAHSTKSMGWFREDAKG